MKKTIVISCETNQPELEKIKEITNCDYPIVYLDSKNHDRPELLKKELQTILDGLTETNEVLLAMGYCGHALVGIRAGDFRMVIPKVDDCLTLFLGSMERRQAESKVATTYFFTKGWLDSNRNILHEYNALVKRFGKESANFVYATMFEHYERLGLIDTGLFSIEPQIVKMKKVSDLLNLRYEVLDGSSEMIQALFLNPEDERFLIIHPFEEITQNHFSYM